MAQSALRFVLAQDISVTIPGMRSIEEVETNVKAGNEFQGLTPREKKRFRSKLAKDYCRDCGLCQPCAAKVDVAAVLRFHTLYEAYGLKKWASKLYGGLEVKANSCNGCRECEPKCAYGLPIADRLKKAHNDLKS